MCVTLAFGAGIEAVLKKRRDTWQADLGYLHHVDEELANLIGGKYKL